MQEKRAGTEKLTLQEQAGLVCFAVSEDVRLAVPCEGSCALSCTPGAQHPFEKQLSPKVRAAKLKPGFFPFKAEGKYKLQPMFHRSPVSNI